MQWATAILAGAFVDAEFVASDARLGERIEVVAFATDEMKRFHGGIARGVPAGDKACVAMVTDVEGGGSRVAECADLW